MADAPDFVPQSVLDFFLSKGLKAGFSWLDIQREEHDRAFTVAKMMQRDLLEETYSVLKDGFKRGDSVQMMARDLRSLLADRGWWGKKVMTDPLTGESQVVQLGSPRRVDVIVRTNMRTAQAAGRWARQDRTRDAFPFLRYVSIMDGKERAEHHAWHNTVLPVGDPWWNTHYGPCDWGCRCRAISLNQRMMTRLGLSVADSPAFFGTRDVVNKRSGEIRNIENGIGAGWDYHPGKSLGGGLAAMPMPGGLDEESAAASPAASDDRFAPIDLAFGLTAANGWSAFFVDAGGWPVAIARHALGRASAATIARFAQLLSAPDEIRWIWLLDKTGEAILARRYVANGAMLEISRAGWRIGKAKDGGRTVWAASMSLSASYDPRQPRDAKGRFASTGRAAMIASLTGDKRVVKSVALGIIPDSAAALLAKSAHVDVAGKSLVVDHSLSIKILREHKEITVHQLFRAMNVLAHADYAEPGGRKGASGAPRFRVRLRRSRTDTYLVGEVHKRTVKIVTLYKTPAGSIARR